MNFWSMGVLVLLLTFTACNDEIAEVQSSELKQIVMTASDFDSEDGSRTNFLITDSGAEFSWAANDTVGIFPNEGAQAFFPMISGAGTKSANFTGGGWALKDASTYGAYYPFIGSFYLDKNSIPVDYTGQKQTGDASTAHLGAYDYMAAIPATPVDGNVTFTFKHLGALVQLKLTVPQPTTLTSVTLTTENNSFAVKGKVDIMTNTRVIESTKSAKELTLDLKDITTTEPNQVVTLYMMIPPVDLSTKVLKAKVKTNSGSEEVILNSKNFLAGKIYAVSGSMEDKEAAGIDGGTVTITTAGTLKSLLGSDYLKIGSLKIVGPINGDDVYYLRKMLGGNNFSEADWGKLTSLDLSEATIVEGGGWYYDPSTNSSDECYTSDDEIGDYMFCNCANLQDIVLPENVVSMGSYAFYDCDVLITIKMKSGSIGPYAFYDCDALSTVEIGDDVTSIGSWAFYDCNALTTIEIGDGVTSIGSSAFYDCDALSIIEIGDGVTSIGGDAFKYCDADVYITNLTTWCNIDFSNSYSNPFRNNKNFYLNNKEVVDLLIPTEITLIKPYAFQRCRSIKTIKIHDNVTSIGLSAFEACGLTSIKIPDSVTLIDNYAFNNCDALTTIEIGDGVNLINDYAFHDCNTLNSVKIGNGVTEIGRDTFNNCDVLTTVEIGDGIKHISVRAFKYCSIKEYYCYATNPPYIYEYVGDASFNSGIKDGAILYVPARCGATYRSSAWGDYFKNIIEID